MVNRRLAERISLKKSIYIKFLHEEGGWSINRIWKAHGKPHGISRATIHRHATQILKDVVGEKVPSNAGRKKLLSERDRRKVMRTFHLARAENPNVQ